MIKLNQPFKFCLLALVLTLILFQANLSAASQEATDSDLFEFLEEPRAETQAAMEVFNTKDSWPGLTVFTVRNFSKGLSESYSHLLFVNNQGKIVKELYHEGFGFHDPQMFNETTLVVRRTSAGYITFWNLETNKQYTINRIGNQWGHHDVWYNPMTDTFVTLGHKNVETEGAIWEVDTIWEFNWKGEILWEWDMSDWVTNYEDTQCMVSSHLRRSTLDYSHSNTIYWDSNTNIIYINARNLDNVWAIEYPTRKVLWRAGRNGNFTMYNKHGVQKDSLWWHSHSFYPVPGKPNKFILFDNDLHNGTAEPNIPAEFEGGLLHTSTISRIVEVEIDTDTWTMRETWSWEAPPEYYSPIWGFAARLPNGNRLGCFGARTFREGKIRTPPFSEGGGSLIEVNEVGEIVWQVTFSTGWGIYRGRRYQPSLILDSPEDLTYNRDENERRCIIWTGKSVFKAYYQITKDGTLLVNNTWTTAKIYNELPSDLEVGTHTYTLTVFDLAGQSVSDTVNITIKNPMTTPTTVPHTTTTVPRPILYHGRNPGIVTIFEILTFPVGMPGVLVVGLVTVGLMLWFKRKS